MVLAFDKPWDLIIIALIFVVLFFGWKQLPDVARSVGRSLRIFKTEMKGMGEDDSRATATGRRAPRAPPQTAVKRAPRTRIRS